MGELLTDERMEAELGDVTASFTSPIPTNRRNIFAEVGEGAGDDDSDVTVQRGQNGDGEGVATVDEYEDEDEGEKTVILKKRLYSSIYSNYRRTITNCFANNSISIFVAHGRTISQLAQPLARIRNLLRSRRRRSRIATFAFSWQGNGVRTATDGER